MWNFRLFPCNRRSRYGNSSVIGKIGICKIFKWKIFSLKLSIGNPSFWVILLWQQLVLSNNFLATWEENSFSNIFPTLRFKSLTTKREMQISIFHLNTLIYFNTKQRGRNWVCHYYAYQIKSPSQIIFSSFWEGIAVKSESRRVGCNLYIFCCKHCRTFLSFSSCVCKETSNGASEMWF